MCDLVCVCGGGGGGKVGIGGGTHIFLICGDTYVFSNIIICLLHDNYCTLHHSKFICYKNRLNLLLRISYADTYLDFHSTQAIRLLPSIGRFDMQTAAILSLTIIVLILQELSRNSDLWLML